MENRQCLLIDFEYLILRKRFSSFNEYVLQTCKSLLIMLNDESGLNLSVEDIEAFKVLNSIYLKEIKKSDNYNNLRDLCHTIINSVLLHFFILGDKTKDYTNQVNNILAKYDFENYYIIVPQFQHILELEKLYNVKLLLRTPKNKIKAHQMKN